MINAKAETVAEKPAYRAAFKARPCLVVADGFYEWAKVGPKEKQPYFITTKGRAPFAFAGLWGWWRAKESVPVTETHGGQTVWQGTVAVFDLAEHPEATRAYAWSSPIEGSENRRFHAVLQMGAIKSPADAVRVAIAAEGKAK